MKKTVLLLLRFLVLFLVVITPYHKYAWMLEIDPLAPLPLDDTKDVRVLIFIGLLGLELVASCLYFKIQAGGLFSKKWSMFLSVLTICVVAYKISNM